MPLAAHLATLPVVAALSGTVSVVGIVANALAGPFVGPATVLGFAAAGLSLVSGLLAAVAGFGAAWSAQLIIWVAHCGRRASRARPGPGRRIRLALVLLAVAGLAPGLADALAAGPALAVLPAALIMIVGFVRPPVQPGWPPPTGRWSPAMSGRATGLVVRVGDGQAVVVDAGPDPAAIDGVSISSAITAVPLLILTHFHADHVDGLAGVLDGRRVGRDLGQSAAVAGGAGGRGAAAGHRARGSRVRTPPSGERVTVGGRAGR